MYRVRKKKIKLSKQLFELAQSSGEVYSKVVVTFWRIQRKKNLWLSKYAMHRLIKTKKIHSQTVQACVDCFYNNLKSWKAKKKAGDKNARPPKQRRKIFTIVYKGQAIKLANGSITLPNGRNNTPIILPWKYEKPVLLSITVKNKYAEITACYKTTDLPQVITGKTVALDLGQIHLATCSDGWSINGRKLRSLRRYQNKTKGRLSALQSSKHKGSKAWRKLQNTKRKQLNKLKNQIFDFTHKATTGIVSTLKQTNVKTLVIGDLMGIRKTDIGKVRNQENHQWLFGKLTWQLSYKAKARGIEVALQNEAYTSSTCPVCGNITKTDTRRFLCSRCNFKAHRDILGAKNILKKYLGEIQVVGGMAPPSGVRIKPHAAVANGFMFNQHKTLETAGF